MRAIFSGGRPWAFVWATFVVFVLASTPRFSGSGRENGSALFVFSNEETSLEAGRRGSQTGIRMCYRLRGGGRMTLKDSGGDTQSERLSSRNTLSQKPKKRDRMSTQQKERRRRTKSKPPRSFQNDTDEPKPQVFHALKFEFSLKSGQYATMLMREIMKNDLRGGPPLTHALPVE
eukprot:CAMPEP_0170172220 /NCGR_PEP_ID=MMETSP0040_2-20121228/5463_1 /TAXON_ID=641309 /ORGANISM="Lotharella oceanica, Strain CCMP622" /LENGTH=174 /DNA_ID=CAMNT_0010412779 /DNA_START=1 /DNA_END=525 /DNA_ORIENTATION=-